MGKTHAGDKGKPARYSADKNLIYKSSLRVHSKITLNFRHSEVSYIGSILGFKNAGIASYFEDFEAEDRVKAARSRDG